jgi:hypothetical protein
MGKENGVYMYLLKCYTTLKKKEILSFLETCIELEYIMLSENKWGIK